MANGLTALKVEKITVKGRYPDGDGLYLQVGPTGSKAWMLRYQLDSKERFMALGSVKTFSLKEARERAKKARQQLADKIDPIEARKKSARKIKLEAGRLETEPACPLVGHILPRPNVSPCGDLNLVPRVASQGSSRTNPSG